MAVTERDAGSDPTAIATTAERAGGGYVIDGEKWFVTVGDVADYLIVLANVLPERAPTLFLVDKDTPGVRGPAHAALHAHVRLRASGVRLLRTCGVGEDAVLGGVGQGYELTRDWFVEERLMIARAGDRRGRAGAARRRRLGGRARPGRRRRSSATSSSRA